MAAIACDICGGTLSMDESGDFAVCDSCGMKHTKDRVKAMAQEVTGTVEVSNIASVESLMKRGHLALEDSNWKQADEYFDKVLDVNPEHAPAYIGKLFSELKIKCEADIENEIVSFNYTKKGESYFQKAWRFADEQYRLVLEGYIQLAKNKVGKLNDARKRNAKYKRLICCDASNIYGVKTSGEVITTNTFVNPEITKLRNIIAISVGQNHFVGLKVNGSVIALPKDNSISSKKDSEKHGQCNISDWCDNDIIEIVAGGYFTAGLKKNGKVVSTGGLSGNMDTSSWRDVVAIDAATYHLVGLKSDGTILVTGRDNPCKEWRDIVAIAASGEHSVAVGLKNDGTIISNSSYSISKDWISQLRDIIDVCAYSDVINVLKYDGTVIINEGITWVNIVALCADYNSLYGLKSDGTVVTTKDNNKGDIASWRNIGPPDKKNLFNKAQDEQRRAEEKRTRQEENQRKIEQRIREEKQRKHEEEQLRQQWAQYWASQGLCRNCGGQLGMFKKCKACLSKN
ncbi:MAG: hypothetical protein FWE83_11340 [Oscillospiraceae bacterium]|nr:hypothetical protein [Oscillospiraceae bacterium]